MTLDAEHDYLAIPTEYCQRLGGLRWCASGEAVEQTAPEPAIGCTFAMAGEIALFLEGYCAGGPLICFGFVLHLLHLLGLGAREPTAAGRPACFNDLASALRETGRPIRNAGALCARLCREVPRVADPPDLLGLGHALRHPTAIAVLQHRLHWPADVPPLTPIGFESLVVKALDQLTPEALRHWLRHGRGPVGDAAETVARIARPNFAELLASLSQRPRLAGALPLVERLSGALTLPPRRLARSALAVGGYADIANRGQPEQILPAQFVLDEIEFLRRFAERELLYYDREPPRAPAAEELMLVLDQGVRTWGDVRLVLAAATLALVRRADRRAIPSRLVTSGTPGRIAVTSGLDPEVLGALLEASDLSPHPAAALESALADPAERPRDVVLLTHPRSLLEPEVAAAARRTAPGTRLFAVAVDGNGSVELAEIRHGAPVVLGRCRASVQAEAAPAPAIESRAAMAAASGVACDSWRGDVEPIGFPFRFGVHNPIHDHRFDFDDRGEWLLAVVGNQGPIHAWRVDGTAAEILPRPSVEGRVLSQVDSVLGVARGFVVTGTNGKDFIAAHYDFHDRVCHAHVIPMASVPRSWWYLRHLHTVVTYSPAGYFALTLGVSKEEASKTRRAVRACLEVRKALPVPVHENRPLPANSELVRLDPASGTITVQFKGGPTLTHTPRSDGQPALAGGRIQQARSGRGLLAVLVHAPRQSTLEFFSDREPLPIDSWLVSRRVTSFALNRDGRRVALNFANRRLEVRELGGSPIPRFVAPIGRCHSTLVVALGPTFLTVTIGPHAHLIRWNRSKLELSHDTSGDPLTLVAAVVMRTHREDSIRTIPATHRQTDLSFGRRFTSGCSAFGLEVLVDIFGQIAVCNSDHELVCMFLILRDKVAAWLPDGTRVGPLELIGGPSTPGGQERIGAALYAAQARKTIGASLP